MNGLLTLPIIVAPMAGGPNTVLQNVAAASMGALGSFGFAYASAQKIDADLSAMAAELDSRMVNANFFIFPENIDAPSQELYEKTVEALKPFGLSNPSMPKPPYFHNLHEQLESVWKHKPRVLTFHFGAPSIQVIKRAHSLDMLVGASCTNIQDAKTLLALAEPVDFLVLQGIEAGGHRGTFEYDNWTPTQSNLTTTSNDEQLPALELLKQVSEITKIPLVVAGGFMNGQHIKQAIQQGATAVQMGTAFLTCTESGTSLLYKQSLLSQSDSSVIDKIAEQPALLTYTKHFSGRPAQGIKNDFTSTLIKNNAPYLEFPLQNTLTSSIRQAAVQEEDASRQSYWAGWGVSQVRQTTTIDLLAQLKREMDNLSF